MSTRWRLVAAVVIGVLLGPTARADGPLDVLDPLAREELTRLAERVPGFAVVHVPARPATVTLAEAQSLTADRLRGVALDERPPVVGRPGVPYDPRFTDAYPPGEAPYVARGIEPFRFRYFNCEFRLGGWHNQGISDYASAHGFNILVTGTRTEAAKAHHPADTRWAAARPIPRWEQIVPDAHVPERRFDLFGDLAGKEDLVGLAVASGTYERGPATDTLMIDIEHPCLTPEQLGQQAWFPHNATPSERAAAEQRYYRGYALSYLIPIAIARAQGWPRVSLYGWQPFPRTWHGLEDVGRHAAERWGWQRYGRDVYQGVDAVHPSVYCFYWNVRNVAYTLANVDLNMRLVRAEPVAKPVRPYYSTRCQGGGPGDRWWRGLPLPNEEVRAMITLGLFTGVDGMVLWDYSGRDNFHVAPRLTRAGPDGRSKTPAKAPVRVMLREGFSLLADNARPGEEPTQFKRYDVAEILAVDGRALRVTFRRIDPDGVWPRVGSDWPRYTMPVEALGRMLRPNSEAYAGVFEGLALAKAVEFFLRHGSVEVDVPAWEQFGDRGAIVRRVRLGPVHVIATYDPGCIHGGEPRAIRLTDFAGQRGLTLVLPADEQVRLFVVAVGDGTP